jgi:predicted transcriptional regulator
MRIKATIRKQVLMGNTEDIRKLLLNVDQIALLSLIGNNTIKARGLADLHEISIQSASGRLSKLHTKGYLTRENVSDPSGGNMFVYECTAQVLNYLKVDIIGA